MRLSITVYLLLMISAAAQSCSRQSTGQAAKFRSQDFTKVEDGNPMEPIPGFELNMAADEKRWWLVKANQTLRLNQPLRDLPNIDRILEMPPHEAAMAIMDDVAFYDMLTDFGMYWLGKRTSQLYSSRYLEKSDPVTGEREYRNANVISDGVLNALPAIFAAREVSQSRNYFDALFSETGLPPLISLLDPDLLDAHGLANPQIRLKIVEKLARFLSMLEQSEPPLSKDVACQKFSEEFPYSDYSFGLVLPSVSEFDDPNAFELSSYESSFSKWCNASLPIPVEFPDAVSAMRRTVEQAKRAAQILNRADLALGKKFPSEGHVTELQSRNFADPTAAEIGPINLWQGVLQYLPNSSTNRNRKRASWALKRFLCDDLTPLNVDIGSTSHGEGSHGSDPACYACHFKLDPMAGYFRELGYAGVSFKNKKFLFFDDGVRTVRETYEAPWLAKPGSGRTWNIGYVRSTSNTSENVYGENFSDFLQMLKTAPEVKECFIRRVFEYAVGEEQAYHRSWGRSLLERYNERAKVDPKAAIKGVFADVVTSHAFMQRERQNNICYDTAPGTTAQSQAPCRISAILDRHCVSCHGQGASNGLNLKSWSRQSDGVDGFDHFEGGVKLPAKVSFSRIMERLNTLDPDLRMPYMKSMPDSERQELFKWFESHSNN